MGVLFLSRSLRNFTKIYEFINFLESIFIHYLILFPEINYILKYTYCWTLEFKGSLESFSFLC